MACCQKLCHCLLCCWAWSLACIQAWLFCSASSYFSLVCLALISASSLQSSRHMISLPHVGSMSMPSCCAWPQYVPCLVSSLRLIIPAATLPMRAAPASFAEPLPHNTATSVYNPSMAAVLCYMHPHCAFSCQWCHSCEFLLTHRQKLT